MIIEKEIESKSSRVRRVVELAAIRSSFKGDGEVGRASAARISGVSRLPGRLTERGPREKAAGCDRGRGSEAAAG